jgi:hypothetical protein
MRTARTSVILILIGLGLSGCKQESAQSTIVTQATDSEGDVQLIVSARPDPEGGLLITATVKNMGQDTFRYTATCGRADMDFRFTNADGHELIVTNPCEPQPMMDCPTALGIVLGPGGTAYAQHWWSGKLWDGCTGTEARAGDYHVTVTFPFYQDIEVGRDQVEATGTFHWSP